MKRMLRKVKGEERGITGLETAIILIAFVVVASVFAYTVLSAGIFSSQKGQEAIYAGLEEARASMAPKGSMFAYGGNVSGNDTVVKVAFTLSNSLRGQAIDLTPPNTWGGNGTALTDSGEEHVTVIEFTDDSQHIPDAAWTVEFIGKNNGDYLLEDEEKAVVTVWLVNYDGSTYSVGAGFIEDTATLLEIYDSFSLEVKPTTGAALIMEHTLPGRIDPIMDLS